MGIRRFTDKKAALTFKVLITNMSLCKLGTFQSLQNASPKSILFACHSILFLSECLYYLLIFHSIICKCLMLTFNALHNYNLSF